MPRRKALLEQFTRRMRTQLRNPAQVLALADSAAGKLASGSMLANQLEDVKGDLRALVALLRSWARGEYRAIAPSALAVVGGALLYFVVPTDAVPDFLLGIGFVDDAAVIAYALRAVRGELRSYRAWQAQRAVAPVATPRTDITGIQP